MVPASASAGEAAAIVLTGRGVWTLIAGAALVAALLASSGLTGQAGSSLLLAFRAVVALSLTRHGPR